MRAAILSAMLFTSVTALADDKPPVDPTKPATEQEIVELRQELAEQRAMLGQIIQLEQQHLAALGDLVAKGGTVALPKPQTPPTQPTQPKPHPQPQQPTQPVVAKTGKGSVSGKISMSGTDSAWVYVSDVSETGGGAVAMKQEGKAFVPSVVVVQRGTTVNFPNADPIFHNVFSVTPGSTFDLGGYPQGQSRSVTMAHAGQVNVFCNIHPQMIGYILVTPGPLFTEVGHDGTFKIANVPTGHHTLTIWAPEAKPVSVEFDVTDGAAATVNAAVAASAPKAHMRKDGTPYGSYNE